MSSKQSVLPIAVQLPEDRDLQITITGASGDDPKIPRPKIYTRPNGNGWLILSRRPDRGQPDDSPRRGHVLRENVHRQPLHRGDLPARGGLADHRDPGDHRPDRPSPRGTRDSGEAATGAGKRTTRLLHAQSLQASPHSRDGARKRPATPGAAANPDVVQSHSKHASRRGNLQAGGASTRCKHHPTCGWTTGQVSARCSTVKWISSDSESDEDGSIIVLDIDE